MYNGAKPYGTCSYDHLVTNDHIRSAKHQNHPVVSILISKANFNTTTSLLQFFVVLEWLQ